MIILVIILLITFLLGLIYLLRGEGDNYNNSKMNRDEYKVSNKNYFL